MRTRLPLLLVLILLVAASCMTAAGEASAGDPQIARSLTDRGIALQQEGNHTHAIAIFDAALAELDHPKIRYFRAKSLRATGQLDRALEEFDAIKDLPQVSKYREEILIFISSIEGERERDKLARRLAAEKAARRLAERDRKAMEHSEDEEVIEQLISRRARLYPSHMARTDSGAVTDRIVPLIPQYAHPSGEYAGTAKALTYTSAIERYERDLTIAKVLTVVGVVGVSVGIGMGLNPLADESNDTTRQIGLAVGVAGLISGLVAIVMWPSAPEDDRPQEPDPFATAGL